MQREFQTLTLFICNIHLHLNQIVWLPKEIKQLILSKEQKAQIQIRC